MTLEETIAQIRQLMAEAAPRPWAEDDGNIFSESMSAERERAITESIERGEKYDQSKHKYPPPFESTPYGFVASTEQGAPHSEADAALIVAMRNSFPDILHELERVSRERDAAVSEMQELVEDAEERANELARELADARAEFAKDESDRRKVDGTPWTLAQLVRNALDCWQGSSDEAEELREWKEALQDLHSRHGRGQGHGTGRATADCIESAIVSASIDHGEEIAEFRNELDTAQKLLDAIVDGRKQQ